MDAWVDELEGEGPLAQGPSFSSSPAAPSVGLGGERAGRHRGVGVVPKGLREAVLALAGARQ